MIRCIMCGKPAPEETPHFQEKLAEHLTRQEETGIEKAFVYICTECELRNRSEAEREGKGVYHPHRPAN